MVSVKEHFCLGHVCLGGSGSLNWTFSKICWFPMFGLAAGVIKLTKFSLCSMKKCELTLSTCMRAWVWGAKCEVSKLSSIYIQPKRALLQVCLIGMGKCQLDVNHFEDIVG